MIGIKRVIGKRANPGVRSACFQLDSSLYGSIERGKQTVAVRLNCSKLND